MTHCSSYHRKALFHQLCAEKMDVLVIGGGITGAGIALDAATRGLKIGLVEMQDFSAGTSSRSTKLIHGGLRYLKQLELKMVADVGNERAIVYENGPHVTTPEWMMLPFHRGGTFGPLTTNIGLRLYDSLARVKKAERRVMLSREEALQKEPLLKRDGLKGAGYYVEYKTDDARLTIEVIKKAVQKGARAVNYAKVTDFIYHANGSVSGVVVTDLVTNETYRLFAKKIINATGPWVDELRQMDGSNRGKTLHVTKGVHLVFSKRVFPLRQAIYFDAPDGRMIFAIPRAYKTYVGTTDTTYDGDLAHPTTTVEDRDYLLRAIRYMFPSLSLTAADVESSWAGLRPLIASKDGTKRGEISRKDERFVSSSNLISIAGGKLTGYRKMAEEVVDLVVNQIKKEDHILYSVSETKHLPISGGDVGGSKGFQTYMTEKVEEGKAFDLSEDEAHHLVSTYGSNVDTLFQIIQQRKEEAQKEQIDPVLFGQLIYGLEYEFVYTPADFFIRRIGALFFDIDRVKKQMTRVTDYMAKALAWTDEQKDSYSAQLIQAVQEAEIEPNGYV